MASDCDGSDGEAEELHERVTHYFAEGTYPPGRPRWHSRRFNLAFCNVKWSEFGRHAASREWLCFQRLDVSTFVFQASVRVRSALCGKCQPFRARRGNSIVQGGGEEWWRTATSH